MTRRNIKTDGSYMAEVGRRLRSFRQSQGWTLAEASEKTGFTTVTISSYERGDRRPSVDQLGHLARAYGVTVATFLPDVAAEPTVLSAEQIAATLKILALELGELTSAVEAIREHLQVLVGDRA